MAIGEALIGLGGNLISGLLGQSGAKAQNEAQERMAEQNRQMQLEFAKNAVSWKVADARNAGISPLYALGAPAMSYSPVSVGSVNEMSPLADAARNMGQDLSRAVHATRSEDDRIRAVADTEASLKLENMSLQNDLLRTQIAKLSRPQVGPAIPLSTYNNTIPGQGDAVKGGPQVVPPPVSPVPKEQINSGVPWMSNPKFSGAQQVQNQYGDIAEDIYGMAVKFPADVWYNWMHNFSPRLASWLWKYRHDFNPFYSRPAY